MEVCRANFCTLHIRVLWIAFIAGYRYKLYDRGGILVIGHHDVGGDTHHFVVRRPDRTCGNLYGYARRDHVHVVRWTIQHFHPRRGVGGGAANDCRPMSVEQLRIRVAHDDGETALDSAWLQSARSRD